MHTYKVVRTKTVRAAEYALVVPSQLKLTIKIIHKHGMMCLQVLAHNAVHAAFAGYAGVTVGLVNTHYVYLPIPVVIQAPRKVSMSLRRYCC